MAYPYLSDVIRALTGYELFLPLPTFGLMVGLAMLAAAACLRRELARLYGLGQIGQACMGGRLVPPQAIVSDLAMIVLVAGVVGSRVFHILEHLGEFRADPWAMIFTRSGLSIFGGLIFGIVAGLVLIRRWKLPVAPVLDAVAPSLMLGYALGRVGCQIAGDGDWGIAAGMALKPGWLPEWLWAQTYEHNIVGEVIALPGVYPTPLYETVMSLACFALLWAWRRHGFSKGWLFSLYLVLAGVERCLIEHIRTNPVLDFGLFRATQAELVSTLFFTAGVAGLLLLTRRPTPSTKRRLT